MSGQDRIRCQAEVERMAELVLRFAGWVREEVAVAGA